IDCIGLFTPPGGRAELVRRCVEAGKPVMTTKPFELDCRAAEDVLKFARQKRVAVELNSPSPYPGADTAQILAWQQECDLGRITGIFAETYASYCEAADGSWYDDPERCPAAPLFRIGIYGINELIMLAGAVESVYCDCTRLRTARPTPDNGMLQLRFVNGSLGAIYCSMCIDDGRPHNNNLLIHFERGSVARNLCGGPAGAADRDAELTLEFRNAENAVEIRRASIPAARRTGTYQWENFHRAISNGPDLPGMIPDDDIVAGIKVLRAMKQSEKTGRSCRINELD
ncbi:MAG: Gfo/Idh/MocA family protein, partial [Victivallaceae bacterium]